MATETRTENMGKQTTLKEQAEGLADLELVNESNSRISKATGVLALLAGEKDPPKGISFNPDRLVSFIKYHLEVASSYNEELANRLSK